MNTVPRRFVRLFKPQFAAAVRAGTKRQTVRPTPARLPQEGDAISLRAWSGKPYRSPQIRLGEGIIDAVATITLDAHGIEIGPELLRPADAAQFAREDGFSDEQQLLEWFDATHGLPFTGILICWTLTP